MRKLTSAWWGPVELGFTDGMGLQSMEMGILQEDVSGIKDMDAEVAGPL